MDTIRIFGAALAFIAGASLSCPSMAAETGKPAVTCTHALAEYNDAIMLIASSVRKARDAAEQNPLLESDVQYYAAVLAHSEQCIRLLTPVTTAAAAAR